jgi:hypothetical protein
MTEFYVQNANGGMQLLSEILPEITIGGGDVTISGAIIIGSISVPGTPPRSGIAEHYLTKSVSML